MFNGLWNSRPSTPRRSSTLKPPPLTPKLTTPEYPQPHSHSHSHNSHAQSHLAHDAQWEHVKRASLSFPEADADEEEEREEGEGGGEEEEGEEGDTAFERIGYSQVDGRGGAEQPRGTHSAPSRRATAPVVPQTPVPAVAPAPVSSWASARASDRTPAPAPAPAPGSSLGSSGGAKPSVHLQEENEKLRQQVESALAAQRKAENDRDRWERRAVEYRSSSRSERERDKEGSARTSSASASAAAAAANRRGERERERGGSSANAASAFGVADTLKEENDKLKTMVQQQTQQLDAVREETKRERARVQSEAERLRDELDAARAARKQEVEVLKTTLQEQVLRIEQLTVDRERARKERDTTKGSLCAEIEQLKKTQAKDAERFKAALDEVNLDRTQAHAELRKTRKSLDECAPKLQDSVREIETLRRELSGSKESQRVAADLKQRLVAQNKELNAAREESSALKKEFNQLVTLLEDRTSELKGAQSFLTTADAFSGVEVTNTLQRLNAEVLQSTAFMAESMVEMFFHETGPPRASKTDEQLAACKRASGVIGGSIVHFLGTKKHLDDPILIQIAFQAYLTYHLRWIACAWIIGGEENHNQFVEAIYRSVHEKEAQAIAGRWRALTRAHVPSTPLDDTQLAYQIANRMISGLSDILLATGCMASKADVGTAFSTKFSEKLSFLISLAMRVNKIVGEDVTSGDFEVLAVPPGTAFDGATMEDSYDDGAGQLKAGGSGSGICRVLCATDLGLRKKTRVGMTGERQWEVKVLLRPKVALESIVDIMDE